MSRPPAQVRRSDVAPDELELFDRAVNRYLIGYLPGKTPEDDVELPTALAAETNSPPFAVAIGAMGTAARTAGERPGGMKHADREWVDQVLSYHWGYLDMLTTHTPDALATGVRLEALEALRDGRYGDLTERERLLTDYVLQVANREVKDETYEAIEADMGPRGAVEFTIFTCYFSFLLHLFWAFADPVKSREDIDVILQGFKDGTSELPDWKAHIR
jgi:hypothetical protein